MVTPQFCPSNPALWITQRPINPCKMALLAILEALFNETCGHRYPQGCASPALGGAEYSMGWIPVSLAVVRRLVVRVLEHANGEEKV